MLHKKTKLKRSVGIRQLYRRISKDVNAILDDIKMKEKNYNVINVLLQIVITMKISIIVIALCLRKKCYVQKILLYVT